MLGERKRGNNFLGFTTVCRVERPLPALGDDTDETRRGDDVGGLLAVVHQE
jgi:hypothetical protein